jgi:hypothetical protein
LRNLDAIVKGLGGENADASKLVRERRQAIIDKYNLVFDHFMTMKRDLVKSYATISEAHEAAYAMASAEMDAYMKLINRLYPERTEDISIARTLAKNKAEFYSVD